MTERRRSIDELALIEQLRELRQSERAPNVFREQLPARLLEALETVASAQDPARRAPGHQRYLVRFWIWVASPFAPGSQAAGHRSVAARLVPLSIVLLGIGAAGGHWATRWAERSSRATVAVDREPPACSPLVTAASSASRACTETPPTAVKDIPTVPLVPGDRVQPRPLQPSDMLRGSLPAEPPRLMDVLPIRHWQLNATAVAHGGTVVAKGRNLVTNGDFSKGAALWSIRVWNDLESFPATIAAHRFLDGALCVKLRAGERRLGGWPFGKADLLPNSFELLGARPYRLSLRAWVSGSLAMQLAVKVGQQTAPYTQTLAALVPVTAERQSFVVDFTAPHSELNGGIAWLASAAADGAEGELCVDDISVTMR